MKESELEKAVGLAANIVENQPSGLSIPDDHTYGYINNDLRLLSRAVIALNNDAVEEDDDAEPILTEPTEGRLDYALFQLVKHNGLGGKTTIEETETSLYDEEQAIRETYAAAAGDREAARPFWPPWSARTIRIEHGTYRMTLFGVDTQDFHLGMRVNLDDAPMDRWSRFKRWLFKRNWRAIDIFGHSVTVERSR